MIVFIARRLAAGVMVLLVASVVVYFLGRAIVPGNIAQVIIGTETGTPAEVAEVRHRLGLDRPLYIAYADWLKGAVTGNMGTSPNSGLTVVSQLEQEIPVSMELTVISMILTTAIGVLLGIIAAVHAGGARDSLIRVLLLTGFAIPGFVASIVLVLVGSSYLGPLYQTEYIPFSTDVIGNLECMVLPVIAVAIPSIAVTVQITRGVMIDALNQPHITMAIAKGARVRNVRYVHALKFAAPAILTFLAFLFGITLGSLVIVETVFNLPGLGRGMTEAVGVRDFQLLVPQVLVVATVFVVANMIVDILHPIIDRRVGPA